MSVKKRRVTKKPAPPIKRGKRNIYKSSSERKTGFELPTIKGFPSIKIPSLSGFWVVLLCAIIGFSVIAGISAGTLWLYRVATTAEYFATKQVEVHGNIRLSSEMVKDFANVHEGDNSLGISITKVEQSLLKTPWVKDVSVKRILPSRFVITVNERLPSFWIKQDDVLYYADEHGKVIAPVETGNFMSLPTLEVESGAEYELKNLAKYLSDLKSGKLPVEFGAISAFRISQDKGLELYLDDREIRLCLALDSWNNNLQRLSITLGDLARRNELSKVREIRASNGNVWVITNT